MHTIAVTGTNGKTTSTHLIRHICDSVGLSCGIVGTLGTYGKDGDRITHLKGLSAKLRYFEKQGCQVAVFEAYSRCLRKGYWKNQKFDAGVFTNLTEDHLNIHGTMEQYADDKGKLFPLCAFAVANLDDPWMDRVTASAENVFTFSTKDHSADLYADNIVLSEDGVRFTAVWDMYHVDVVYHVPGMFSVYNALTAIACVMQIGVSLSVAAKALATAPNVKGRAEKVETGSDFSIYIDFAHTPDGMEQICKTMRQIAKHRLVVVFGCGGNRERAKRPQMASAAAKYADYVVITSDNPRMENPMHIIDDIIPGIHNTETAYKVIPDRREAIRHVIETHLSGDVIVICGKGHEVTQTVGRRAVPFDEREIIRSINLQ